VALGGVLVAPAGAAPLNVSSTGACFGYPTSGGCRNGYGGSLTGLAGGSAFMGFALTTPSTLGSGDTITIDASSGAAGTTFPGSGYQLNNDTTLTGCPAPGVQLSNGNQTATVPIPTGCAATTTGTHLVLLVTGVTSRSTVGPESFQIHTSKDTTAVSTNNVFLDSVPDPPTSPSATAKPGAIALQWTDPTNDGGSAITEYDVYCSTTNPPSTGDTPSATVSGADATSLTVTGLTNDAEYFCVVTAVNAMGQSAASDVVNATPQLQVPGAPTSASATGGAHSMTVSWVDPVDDGGSPITQYDVYCADTVPSISDPPSAIAPGATASQATVTGLQNGTGYNCVVTAVNGVGQSAASNTTFAVAGTPPSPPLSPSVTPGNGQATITWTKPASSGGLRINEWRIYCSTTNPPAVTFANECGFSLAHKATSGTAYGLVDGTTYYFVVTASNANGESPPSDVVSATPSTVPGRPTHLHVRARFGSLRVSWQAPYWSGGSPITGYNVYCSESSPPSTAGTPSATVDGSTTQVRVPGLTSGTTYYCVVTAVNVDGQSKPSHVKSATPF
jgi:fibronectin type 3 domain-containing protein